MFAMNQPAAGWHPDPEYPGYVRHWDGVKWTEHRAPAPAEQQPTQPTSTVSVPSILANIRWGWVAFIGVGIVLAIFGYGSSSDSGSGHHPASQPHHSSAPHTSSLLRGPTCPEQAAKVKGIAASKRVYNECVRETNAALDQEFGP